MIPFTWNVLGPTWPVLLTFQVKLAEYTYLLLMIMKWLFVQLLLCTQVSIRL